jgi:CheY-like chemotaxis protein
VGKGTTFRIQLPVMAVVADQAVVATDVAAVRRIRLLVIDDDLVVGRSIARRLKARHAVVYVDNAPQALADLAAGTRFDVILCDLMMPTMNGIEFYNRLQTIAPEYAERVIFMTGGAFTEQASDFIDDPSRRRIEKPFALETLERALQQVVTN